MRVYTLLSHTTFYLPYQLQLLHKYVEDPQIVVVQDDSNPYDGHVRLTDAEREAWGVEELLSAPATDKRGLERADFIASYLIATTTGPALIIHGDMLPLKPVTMDLLQGKSLACRGYPCKGTVRLGTHWLLYASRPAVSQLTMAQADMQLYGCQQNPAVIREHVPELSEVDAQLGLEWCEPSWLHCSRMRYWGRNPAQSNAKRKLLSDWLGEVVRPEPSETDREILAGPPPISTQLLSYTHAVAEWVAAGRPERSDEEVERIYTQCCLPCPNFLKDQQRCGRCGCRVSGSETGLANVLRVFSARAIVNKARMATQHCPRKLW